MSPHFPLKAVTNALLLSLVRPICARVLEQMRKRLDLEKIRSAYFHTGKKYREHLIPKLELAGVKCIVPLEGLSFGRQLTWYDVHLKNVSKRKTVGINLR